MSSWNNLHYFVADRIFEDYYTLNGYASEFSVTETTRTAIVPSGQRKIALSIMQNDFLVTTTFYLRHSDGTWSHKPGSTAITDYSITSNVKITDANIETTSKEGGYVDGTRYFLINKSVVVDFPHNYGQYSYTTYTTNDFRDMAGDVIEKSFAITGNWNSRFDYTGDKDFFKFTPTVSGTYTISTDRGAGYDIDGAVFDSNGNVLVSDYTTSNANFNIYLNAYSTYYIYMTDYQQNTGCYILWC